MRLISLLLLLLSALLPAASRPENPASLHSGRQQVRVNGRVATFASVVEYCGGDSLQAAQISTPLNLEGSYLTGTRLRAERFYNAIHPDTLCFLAALLATILAISQKRRVSFLISAGLLIILLASFALRWYLAGIFPLCTVSDTLSASALVMTLILCLLQRGFRPRAYTPVLFIITLLTLGALLTSTHPAVRPINPALVSAWLPIHVSLIICAYSCFLTAAVASFCNGGKTTLFPLLLWGDLLLAAGIICGGLWAMKAWGSFWSWDPKETAALLTFLAYLMLILFWRPLSRHPHLRRLLPAIAFAAVIATWFGITSGLHAY